MKLKEVINEDQFGLIVGSLLGDASIPRRLLGTGNHYIDITHSEKQYEYLIYKKRLFENLGFKVSKVYKRQVKSYRLCSIHIYFRENPKIMNTLRWWFYNKGYKSFNRNMVSCLTPLGIAIWFMDDGCRAIHYQKNTKNIKGRELYISTYMSHEEHRLIINYFSKKNIEIKEVKDRDKFRLRLNSTNAKKFIKLIYPYICPSMYYKIDLQYK